ncbi:hypothetical protein MTO96_043591 [Rhipicephalus appendiculatus]
MEQQNNVADSAAMRPFGPPPVFRGQADEDVEDWLRIYDRYSMALNWNDAQKARNLVFVLDDEARRWYSAVLRDATATQHLDSWAEWRDALLRDFAGEHIRDWAYIQLQERRQLPGETPRQYVTSILQLCARANTSMTESEKVRCLIPGLRPEMMERVAISNPKTATDFLQHLQRLTHVGTMAQHAMAAMPRHALPGFVAASPFAPGTDTSPGLGMTAASHNRSGNSEKHANTEKPGTSDQSQMLTVLQESIKALTIAMERIAPHPARGYPSNPSRNARGQVICFRCHQEGHVRRQCQEPLQETGEYLPQQGQGN